ncbi:MAG: glycosyltransferase family 9 protein, partial [Candidatus Micrarchaeota archaeon]
EHAFRFILLSYLIGARNRVGYDAEGRGFLLTKKVDYPPYGNRDRLELEYYLDLIRAIGIPVKPEKRWMNLYFGKKEKDAAEKFLRENKIGKNDLIVGVHAGGGIWKKRWPLYKFAKFCDLMVKKHHAKIIAFGGKEDVALYGMMQKMMRGKIAVAAGKMNVLETAALLGKCKLVVANDSAVSHIAATTDARVLALFGVDSPKRWAPFGNTYIMKHTRLTKCAVLCNYDYLYAIDRCFDDKAPYCMNLISVEEVVNKAEGLLKEGRK